MAVDPGLDVACRHTRQRALEYGPNGATVTAFKPERNGEES